MKTEQCCKSQKDKSGPICNLCGQPGQKVDKRTIRFLVKGKWQKDVRDDVDYYFLSNPDCSVVYFSTDMEHFFSKDQLRIRVGQKEYNDPIPLCYCFNFYRHDIKADIKATGQTRIPDFIKKMVKEKVCACEITNPQGRCCLGNITKAIKEIKNETH